MVEFRDKADWDYCIKKLDHVKLDGVYIRVHDEREYNRRKLKEQGPIRRAVRPRDVVRRSRSRSRGRDDRRMRNRGDITAGSMPGYRDDRGAGGGKRRQRFRSQSVERKRGGGYGGRAKRYDRDGDGRRERFDNRGGGGGMGDRYERRR